MITMSPAQVFPSASIGATATTKAAYNQAPSSAAILGVTAVIVAGLGITYYLYKNPTEYDRWGQRIPARR